MSIERERGSWQRMRRAFLKHPIVLAISLAFIAVALLYLVDVAHFLAHSSPALTVVEVNTEWVEVVEAAPIRGQVLLSPAMVTTESNPTGRCLRGTLFPSAGSQMRISRQGAGPASLEFLPAPNGLTATFDGYQRVSAFREPLTVRFGGRKDRCRDERGVVRVPIFGATTLGSDYSADTTADSPALLVRSGRVETFARVSSTMLSRLLARIAGSANGATELFPVGSIELPAGARVRECAPDASRVSWSGWAEIKRDVTDVSDRNMTVVAYTDAERIALSTPGGSRTGGAVCETAPNNGVALAASPTNREDVIGVSLLARIAGDPNIASESLLAGFFILTLQVLISLVELKRSKHPGEVVEL